MIKNPRSLQEDINDFLSLWASEELTSFLIDVLPLVELYNVDEEKDWVRDEVGQENTRSVRLARTVYLLSRFAEAHASRLFNTNTRFKGLWRRMEEEVK